MAENLQTTSTQTQTTSNFDAKADKWWESRWAFVMAVALPLISIMTVYTALQISDTKQTAAIASLEKQQLLFMQGDFKDSQQRVTDLMNAVNEQSRQIVELKTIINERIPAKK